MRGIYGKAEGTGGPDEWRHNPSLAGGGILFDQGIHVIDLFRYFMGEFTEIKSMCTSAYWDYPVEDNAFALLRNDKGQIAIYIAHILSGNIAFHLKSLWKMDM